MILAVGIAYAALTFPWGDIGTAIQKPSPASILQVAADVAASAVPFAPAARIAALALPIAVIMAKHPARLPMRQAQTYEARGGRRA
jgi:hypothetical protein